MRQLLEFARKRPLEVREINVNDVVQDILPLVKNQASFSNVEIREHLGSIPSTLADANQLKQVFINLTNNAIFAMQDTGGGSLTVKTGESDGGVFVEFQDTGTGIPEEVLPRIFEPFFSTKREQGTGLGLSISYSIIQNHGGRLAVASESGKGSTFTVTLPVKTVSAQPR